MARNRSKLITAATGLLLASAGHADTVAFRAGDHSAKGYGRIVFEWPAPVGFEATLEDGRLVVRFERTVEADLSPAVRHLGSYLADPQIADDGRLVSFALKRPVEPRATREGNLVIVDLLLPSAAATSTSVPAQAAAPTASGNSVLPSDPAAQAPAAADAPVIGVRTGDQPGYARVVFDWAQPVDYVLDRGADALVISFDRPGRLVVVPRNLRASKNVGEIRATSENGLPLSVRIAVPPGSEVREGRSGHKVFLDIGDAPAGQAATSTPAPPAETPEAAVAEVQVTPEPDPEPKQARAEAPPAAEAPQSPDADPPTPAPSPAPDPQEAEEAAAAVVTTPPVQASSAAPVPTSPMAGAGPQAQAEEAEAAAGTASADGAADEAILLDAGEPAGLAVYRRGDFLWVVFDRVLRKDPAYVAAELNKALGGAAMVPNEPGSVFRFPLPSDRHAAVIRDEAGWRIALLGQAAPPEQALLAQAEPDFPLGPRVVIPVDGQATVIERYDQELGRIYVVALERGNLAFAEEQRFPDAEILPSLQGIVIRPVSDDVVVRAIETGVEIVGQEGLHLAPTSDRPDTTDHARLGQSLLLPIVEWQRGGVATFDQQRQLLIRRVQDAGDKDKDRFRLDLGRFYFAHGHALEALGVLQIVSDNVPGLASRPEFKALRGAARAFAGDAAGALSDLADPRLGDEPEAALFRALAHARSKSWDDAASEFGKVGTLADEYPAPFYRPVVLAAAETALNRGSPDVALAMLDRVAAQRAGAGDEDDGAIQYLRGAALHALGDRARARTTLETVLDSRDRFHAARARLKLAELGVEDGTLTHRQAADDLDGLRFSWRGDDLELEILARMGRFRLKAGEWEAGLAALREVVEKFPDHPRSAEVAQELNGAFADIFLDAGMRDAIEPTRAFSLLTKFGNLVPAGQGGDRIIEALAQTLADADHLDNAAQLLKDLMEHRVSGVEKARIGAKLASVRLLIGDPDGALAALAGSALDRMPFELGRSRRLLEARALSELGRIDEAVAALDGDGSREAELLRVDFAWRARQWQSAADGLARLLDPPPTTGATLAPEAARMVLNQAVLLTLAGDDTRLYELRNAYGVAMEQTPDADAFRIITRPESTDGELTLSAIRQRVGEVDVFRSFLDSYRRRGPEDVAPPAAQPPGNGVSP